MVALVSELIKRGKPESFGWLRRKLLDPKHREDIHAWERPDGKIIYLKPGSEVIRGPRMNGIVSRFKRGKA
jgi:hypothetical protein